MRIIILSRYEEEIFGTKFDKLIEEIIKHKEKLKEKEVILK
jgi:hypothetical protein